MLFAIRCPTRTKGKGQLTQKQCDTPVHVPLEGASRLTAGGWFDYGIDMVASLANLWRASFDGGMPQSCFTMPACNDRATAGATLREGLAMQLHVSQTLDVLIIC